MEFNQCLQYLRNHYLEILGTLTGLIYIYYTIKRKRILWLFGGLSSLFYIGVFYRTGLLAYMSLYFYYVAISIYGWFAWAPAQDSTGKKEISINRLKARSWALVLAVTFLLFLILWLILHYFHHAELLWADALLTAASIVATWLLTRKVIDQWLLWIVIDILSGLVSLYKGLPFAAFLFFIYTLLAIKGYAEWKKELPKPGHP
jgi:nicotinamide mononucleotide transporter